MPGSSPQTLVAVLLAGVLGLGLAGCGDDDGGGGGPGGQDTAEAADAETQAGASGGRKSPETASEIADGVTSLRLADSLTTALGVVGIDIEPTDGAKRVDGALQFPIERGEIDIDSASGRLEHRGGLRFSVAGRDVEATDLVVEPGRGLLTAEVAGRRLPLFALDMGRLQAPGTPEDPILWPASAGLSKQAASSINDRLGVDVLQGGLSAGRVTIDARRP